MLKVNIKSVNVKSKLNSITLLNNINFNITPNNIYTIIGSNGSGKSTLLATIMQLNNKSGYKIDGKIFFNNLNLLDISEKEFVEIREKNFRYIFQDPISALDPLKKINYYFKLFNFSHNKIEEELKFFQLPKYSELCKLFPHQLSTGMAQRINIVLALLSEPKILLLDEPTSALDLPVANLLIKRLKNFVLQNDNSVILVTQDLLLAKAVSNYIAKMSNGNLSSFSSPSTFFEEVE